VADLMRLGRVAYADVHALQQRLVQGRADGTIPQDVVILCEHDPVYTVGRKRGATANVLAPGDVPVVEVERGGDVTFHGPGQLVCYPILLLEGAARDLHAHLHRLEQLMIDACADLGVTAGRDARNTGAWAGGRKIGSVGVACRRWVTWHGLALNVDTDLSYFERINPCGLEASLITSVSRERGERVPVARAQEALEARVAAW
jgi:lipoate-protein ligase B